MSKKTNIPPSATDLEELVLGGLMIDAKAADDVMIVIKNPDVFYDLKHRYIFSAIQSLYHENTGIDIKTVSDRLQYMGKHKDAGGDLRIIELTKKVASGAHVEFHSRILLQRWMRREFIRNSSILSAKAYDLTEDVFDILDEAASYVDAINEQISGGTKEVTMADALSIIRKRIEILSSKEEGEITGIPTGFNKVDRFTGGWQGSDLIILAARPGMGKTALMLNNILECAKREIPCGVISLEMPVHQLVTRLVACNSHFHLNQLFRHGFDKPEYFTTFLELESKMVDYPIYFDDLSTDIRDIYTKARMWKRKYGIQMLVVDYIQLAGDRNKSQFREQEVSSITRNLKKLAKELEIPIIALSQLNREVETRSDKRPKPSDLRESGAIEQDADIIIFIYRPEYYGLPADADADGNTQLIFAKYRNGSLGNLYLHFDHNKTKFIESIEVDSDETEDDMPF